MNEMYSLGRGLLMTERAGTQKKEENNVSRTLPVFTLYLYSVSGSVPPHAILSAQVSPGTCGYCAAAWSILYRP